MHALPDYTRKHGLPRQTTANGRMADELVTELYEQIRRQANELREKNAELQCSNEVKLAFLRSISHEVRTPLTISMGYSGMLLDGLLGPLSEEQSKAVGTILRQSTELLISINNVLAI